MNIRIELFREDLNWHSRNKEINDITLSDFPNSVLDRIHQANVAIYYERGFNKVLKER